MKIQIDTTHMTISVCEDIIMEDLINELESLIGNRYLKFKIIRTLEYITYSQPYINTNPYDTRITCTGDNNLF